MIDVLPIMYFMGAGVALIALGIWRKWPSVINAGAGAVFVGSTVYPLIYLVDWAAH